MDVAYGVAYVCCMWSRLEAFLRARSDLLRSYLERCVAGQTPGIGVKTISSDTVLGRFVCSCPVR